MSATRLPSMIVSGPMHWFEPLTAKMRLRRMSRCSCRVCVQNVSQNSNCFGCAPGLPPSSRATPGVGLGRMYASIDPASAITDATADISSGDQPSAAGESIRVHSSISCAESIRQS